MKNQLRIGLTAAFLLCCMCLLSLAAAASAPKTTEQTIDENLDILISEPYQYFSEQEMIHAHPDAYQNIRDLGEEAVPYLRKLAGEDGSTSPRNYRTWEDIARESMANYLLAMRDFSYKMINLPSPNQQYILHMRPVSFMDSHDDTVGIQYVPYLETVQTGELTLIDPEQKMVYTSAAENQNEPIWSDDSRYLLFCEQSHFLMRNVYVYDTENAVFFALPTEWQLEKQLRRDMNVLPSRDSTSDDCCNYPRFIFKEWMDNTVRMEVVLQNKKYTRSVPVGYYVYDLEKQEIVQLSYTIAKDSPLTCSMSPQKSVFPPDHMSLLVRRDLEALIESAQPDDIDQDMIRRHPEAFQTLFSYGDDAVYYLWEITKCGIGETELQKKSASRVMAYMLLQMLDRDRIVTDSVSPNGKFTLNAAPQLFYYDEERGMVAVYRIQLHDNFDMFQFYEADRTYLVPFEDYHNFRVTWSLNSQYVTVVPVNQYNETIPGNDMMILWDVLDATYSYPTDMDAIRTLFANEGADIMLDRDPADYLHTPEEMRAFIDENMTEILDKCPNAQSTQEMTAAVPKAFARLKWLGKAALPHLMTIEQENQTRARKGDLQSKRLVVLSMAIRYAITPESFEKRWTSPDRSYTVLAHGFDFYDYFDTSKEIPYQNITIKKNTAIPNNPYIARLYEGEYHFPNVKFSPNSKYFVLQSFELNKQSTVQLFSQQTFEELPTLTLSDIDQEIKEKFPKFKGQTLVRKHASLKKWSKNNQALFDYWFQYQDADGMLRAVYGDYLYDLETQELVYITFNSSH
ncbi:MAG: hypothetical protein J6I50_06250 [Clostridia bacterium]|nr:hypothetical protein [Clostridia bacterium]